MSGLGENVGRVEFMHGVADSVVHYARHGQAHVALNACREVFRSGLDDVEILLASLAATCAEIIDHYPGCPNPEYPMWPKPCGRVSTDSSRVSPTALWAARWIAAFCRHDYVYANDLFDNMDAEFLADATEALVMITALWTNISEGKTRP